MGCEFSGIVREAFRARGHEAWSCDRFPTEIPSKYHFQGDIGWPLLAYGWDLLIAFPPCTHLSASGARWWKDKAEVQEDAIKFVKMLAGQDLPRIAIENPVGRLSTGWRKPDQIIQPWQFGHGETKTTCLWLKNLPKLQPTNIVEGRYPRVHRMSKTADRWKKRSRTYQGIAEAMADQWGDKLQP